MPEYLALDALSRSEIVKARPGRMLEWSMRDSLPREETAALRLGSAFDCLVLEPTDFASAYHEVDVGSRNAKAYKEAVKEHPGKTVLLASEVTRLVEMSDALADSPHEKWLSGDHQVTIVWTDDETGLRLKARPDCIHVDDDGKLWVVDLKTTIETEASGFVRSSWKYGYVEQAAHYIDGVSRALGEVAGFIFVAVGKAAPHIVRAYQCADEMIVSGYRRRDEALARIAMHNELDDWTEVEDREPTIIGAQEISFDD